MNAATKEIAMELVSSAENSSLNWRAQYGFIEDMQDGRGYTAGIIGFCTGTGDLLDVVRRYTARRPDNRLAPYLPALAAIDTARRAHNQELSASHVGLDPGFVPVWRASADDPLFQAAQDSVRDQEYFDPAVQLAVQDGLRPLGQFAYYDATVMHGLDGLLAIREATRAQVRTPANGGDEGRYLSVFLAQRKLAMKQEAAHHDTSRVDDEQLAFLKAKNLTLSPPLAWHTYGDSYQLKASAER
jgi:chitosanase